ncbi:MAG: DeoR/GlpR transcriptional regulator, partial [Alphaproteobacteria bacterium]
LDVAHLFENREDVTLIVCGGQWDVRARAFRGVTAQSSIAAHRADWAILGACALHPRFGATGTNEDDAQMKRAMAAASARTMILVDHSKRDQVAAHLVLAPENVDLVVTDQAWPELEETGVEVVYTPR